MGKTFTATTKSAEAPDVEGGLYDAKFNGVTVRRFEGGQYGDGDRYVWSFVLLDDDGDVMYDEGDPVEVDGLTSTSTNVLSKTTPKAVRFLKALMTPAEFAAFEGGEGIDEDSLIGRVVQVDVAIRDNGWPTISNVLPKRKRRAGSKATTTDDAE